MSAPKNMKGLSESLSGIINEAISKGALTGDALDYINKVRAEARDIAVKLTNTEAALDESRKITDEYRREVIDLKAKQQEVSDIKKERDAAIASAAASETNNKVNSATANTFRECFGLVFRNQMVRETIAKTETLMNPQGMVTPWVSTDTKTTEVT
jgi:uncharacterized coiled-coil DUF342 family protein